MKEIAPYDLKVINSVFEDRKKIFIQLCEGKMDEQMHMVKDDDLVNELRDILERYQPN